MELTLFIFQLCFIVLVLGVTIWIITTDSPLSLKVPLVLLMVFIAKAFVKNLTSHFDDRT